MVSGRCADDAEPAAIGWHLLSALRSEGREREKGRGRDGAEEAAGQLTLSCRIDRLSSGTTLGPWRSPGSRGVSRVRPQHQEGSE